MSVFLRSLNFQYKHIDEAGHEMLDAISVASRFNKWMYETIAKYCHGNIMEIGSGVGNISSQFLAHGEKLVVSDIRESYRKILSAKFPNVEVLNIDITVPDFDKVHASLIGKFDSVFALNVVEHIKDDDAAVRNMSALVKPGGTVIVLVPAFQSLYNGIDHALEHYKRYSKKELETVMGRYGTIHDSFFFNAAGIPAWWVGGRLFRQNSVLEGEMRLYDFFVPVFKVFDRLLGRRIGLSVVTVIRKA